MKHISTKSRENVTGKYGVRRKHKSYLSPNINGVRAETERSIQNREHRIRVGSGMVLGSLDPNTQPGSTPVERTKTLRTLGKRMSCQDTHRTLAEPITLFIASKNLIWVWSGAVSMTLTWSGLRLICIVAAQVPVPNSFQVGMTLFIYDTHTFRYICSSTLKKIISLIGRTGEYWGNAGHLAQVRHFEQ